MLTSTRLLGVAGLAAVLVSGCGRWQAPNTPSTGGAEKKVTFYVKGMGERLNLL